MAELQTLARPYAKATFELAHEAGALKSWSEQLAQIASAVSDPQVQALITHPALTRAQLAAALSQALEKSLSREGLGFLRLLAENGRLSVAGKIVEQFEALRAEAESRIDVEITTAAPVADAQAQSLAQAIGQRLAREVAVEWKTDDSLIAGAVIRAGDLVIDGSAKGELERLQQVLGK